ncbi:AmmeMemoRadiSam system protein B [Myxococcus sp. RHSTA-1-4]|uniref:AmmeMemoRadiSam system protein B n=1 Tax=Myxococcus sp. RHSTA-1-4 TaxID=2874601 RepID=UPI001CC00C1B|nr:AmmeMemoRadiSam system protein B [Myxococcus sp. RHSTA-1-4]MBZ4419149.1 AmmeMemoRadiSam system protein B [Myxococcus sp. RHSTA-1-4]
MPRVRPPAAAGSFYPASPSDLAAQVDGWLDDAAVSADDRSAALIVPHAGYAYSGPVAASAYATLRGPADRTSRVLLMGPCHFLPLRGLVWPDVDVLCTPLGEVPLDEDLRQRASAFRQVTASTRAHKAEYALEVQLPFLQRVLGRFSVLPLLVGTAHAEEVAEVLDALWDSDVLPVVTSDLSHYLPYEDARAVDRNTAERVLALDSSLDAGSACGAAAICGLLLAARKRDLQPRLLDLRSSGDTGGARTEVVGYGAFAFYLSTGARS